MSKANFTVEELTALKELKKASLSETISSLTESIPYYNEETEKAELVFVKGLLEKLKTMSDEQFNGLDYSNTIDVSDVVEE